MKKGIGSLSDIRKIIYSITTSNINGSKIIKDLLMSLCNLPELSETKKYDIIQYASIYEHTTIIGRREIHSLDKFVIDVIKIFNL